MKTVGGERGEGNASGESFKEGQTGRAIVGGTNREERREGGYRGGTVRKEGKWGPQ